MHSKHMYQGISALFIAAILWLLSSPATAYHRIKPSVAEWESWPDHCKGASHTFVRPPEGHSAPTLSKHEREIISKFGAWHYCHGYIMVQRLEANTHPSRREEYLRFSLEEIRFSLERAYPRTEPLAAAIAVTYARALRQAKKPKQALKLLDTYRKLHPSYPPLYTAYIALLFDNKQYADAIKILEEGNKATGDKVGQLQYFLGLAYFKEGQIEQARIYEQKARENKFWARALTRKLAAYDAKMALEAKKEQ